MAATSGIVFLALGHKQYGRLAINAAACAVVATSRLAKLTLVHDGRAIAGIPQKELDLFDTVVQMEPEDYTLKGVFRPFWAKLNLWKYVDYDYALYLDADVALYQLDWPAYVASLKAHKADIFTYGSHVVDDKLPAWKHHWEANLHEIRKALNVPSGYTYHDINSSWLAWKNAKPMQAIFIRAAELFGDFPVPFQTFADAVPDELPLGTALYEKNIMLAHSAPWQPLNDPKSVMQYNAKPRHGLSMQGHFVGFGVQDKYKALVLRATRELGVSCYPWVNKRNFDSSRVA